MNAELRFHIEARATDLVANGLERPDALRRARLEFGAVEKYKEEIRGARGLRLIDELRADLLYGLRSFRRSPAFAIVATVSLALGIGANTLIFSVLDSTFLRPLGYRDPSQLAVIWTAADKKSTTDEHFERLDLFCTAGAEPIIRVDGSVQWRRLWSSQPGVRRGRNRR